jgi:hypothetical protein
MRFRILPLFLCVVAMAIPVAGVLHGCGVPPDDWIFHCNPDATVPAPDCVPDAGKDGSADGNADGPSAAPARCEHQCVPVPLGDTAGLWREVPGVVWVGPRSEMPDCPPGADAEKLTLYADLIAPPLVCDLCDCEPSEGECTKLPPQIQIRAGTCAMVGASTLPFEGPPDWDGSCTDVNAVPADAKCPEGSPTLCAQVVSVSPLPPPSWEACAVKVDQVPTFSKSVNWGTAARACLSSIDPYTCADDAQYCVPAAPPPWRQCIWREGQHEDCPVNYAAERFVMYPESGYEDKRDCTPCTCGAPMGSGCLGTMRLYDDATCASQCNEQMLSSFGEQCGNIWPPGRAIGSKSITDLTYIKGACVASGGEAIGEAYPKSDTAVTFCCRAMFDTGE